MHTFYTRTDEDIKKTFHRVHFKVITIMQAAAATTNISNLFRLESGSVRVSIGASSELNEIIIGLTP